MAVMFDGDFRESVLAGNILDIGNEMPVFRSGNCCLYIRWDDETNDLAVQTFYGEILSIAKTKELIRGLQMFVESSTEEDVVKLNKEIREANERKWREHTNSEHTTRQKNKKPGFIYFVRDDQGRVKIGKAKKLKERLGEYTKLPVEPELLYAFESDNYDEVELLVHEYYKDKRLRGEWFALTDNDIRFIQKGKLEKKIQKQEM